MPRAEVDAKARDLILPIMGDGPGTALIDGLWQLETLDAAALEDLLAAACAAIPEVPMSTSTGHA